MHTINSHSESSALMMGFFFVSLQVERYVRDLRVHTILEGTNEIMRVVMARHMIKSQM